MGQKPSSDEKEVTAELSKSQPLKGLLYAQLGMDSDNKKVTFRMSQKVAFGKSTSMKLHGSFQDGMDPHCRVQVTHKDFVPQADVRVNCRLRYDLQKQFVKSSVYVKKKIKINKDTVLNMRAEAVGRVSEMGEKSSTPSHPQYRGRVEISKTWINATSTQDCRLRIGADVGNKRLYLQVRENHLMVTCDSAGQWKFIYDV